jgi:pimeloyl-ACP methyl ester carboxylesterase
VKLALIDTSARPDTPESSDSRRKRIEQVAAGKFGLVVQQSFGGSVHPSHKEDAALLAIHTAMSTSNGPEVYVRQQQAIIDRPDSRGELGHINVSTLILVGEGDAITPPEVASEMQAGITGSELAVISDAGHLALLEQPVRVGKALAKWAAA